MHVHVHESGRHDHAGDAAHLRALGRSNPRSYRGDLAVLDQQVGHLVEAAARVDHAPPFEEQGSYHSEPRFAASASSGRPPASR